MKKNEIIDKPKSPDTAKKKNKAEETMYHSEEKYRTILENIEEGYYEVNLAGNFTFFNDSMYRILGYPRDEMIGMNYQQYTDKENATKLYKTFTEVYKTGEPAKGSDWHIIRKDGTKRVGEVSVSLLKDASGNPIGFRGITRDATERKQMEETIHQSEVRYRTILDEMGDGYFELNLAGNFIFVNNALCIILGYTREELIGMNFRGQVAEEDIQRTFNTFANIYKTGKPERGISYQYMRKNGTIGCAETTAFPLENQKGETIGFRGIGRDITERKQAEAMLWESRERYRTLVENASDIVFRTDDSGHFTFVNPAMVSITGYTEEEIIGKHYKKLVRPDKFKGVVKFLVSQYEKLIPSTYYEFPVINKDGHEVWFGQNTQLIVEDCHVTGFQAVARDITERKRAEDALQKAHDDLESQVKLRTAELSKANELLQADITERKQAVEKLRKAFSATIQVLVSAVEIRDPYTAGHQLRVADLARTIATEMGLPQDKIEGIRMAGSTHDIGKLSIPSEILSRPAKLTKIEFSMIKEHSQKGYDMLKDVESLGLLAQIIYQHHERMDGSGYPRNLKGDEILMEARIMAVADVVEAMASHRPYRAALGIEVALEEIEKNKGIIYDADVADACLILFREKGYQFK